VRELYIVLTFALVVKLISYKLLFTLTAAYNLEIEQMNIKTAFFIWRNRRRYLYRTAREVL
jgi:hypothetical protein